MTRKRQKMSLLKHVFEDCPYCSGSGYVMRIEQTYRRLKYEFKGFLSEAAKQFGAVVITANPAMAHALEGEYFEHLRALLPDQKTELIIRADLDYHVEDFTIQPVIKAAGLRVHRPVTRRVENPVLNYVDSGDKLPNVRVPLEEPLPAAPAAVQRGFSRHNAPPAADRVSSGTSAAASPATLRDNPPFVRHQPTAPVQPPHGNGGTTQPTLAGREEAGSGRRRRRRRGRRGGSDHAIPMRNDGTAAAAQEFVNDMASGADSEVSQDEEDEMLETAEVSGAFEGDVETQGQDFAEAAEYSDATSAEEFGDEDDDEEEEEAEEVYNEETGELMPPVAAVAANADGTVDGQPRRPRRGSRGGRRRRSRRERKMGEAGATNGAPVAAQPQHQRNVPPPVAQPSASGSLPPVSASSFIRERERFRVEGKNTEPLWEELPTAPVESSRGDRPERDRFDRGGRGRGRDRDRGGKDRDRDWKRGDRDAVPPPAPAARAPEVPSKLISMLPTIVLPTDRPSRLVQVYPPPPPTPPSATQTAPPAAVPPASTPAPANSTAAPSSAPQRPAHVQNQGGPIKRMRRPPRGTPEAAPAPAAPAVVVIAAPAPAAPVARVIEQTSLFNEEVAPSKPAAAKSEPVVSAPAKGKASSPRTRGASKPATPAPKAAAAKPAAKPAPAKAAAKLAAKAPAKAKPAAAKTKAAAPAKKAAKPAAAAKKPAAPAPAKAKSAPAKPAAAKKPAAKAAAAKKPAAKAATAAKKK
jgi:hypothetical protein